MQKLFITVIFLLFSKNIISQSLIESVFNYNKSILDKSKYKMVIISDSGCGYCNIVYKKIKPLTDSLQVIILDYSQDKKIHKYYKDYTFISAPEIKNKNTKQESYPVLFLYNKSNKLIWKKKGWFKKNLQKIKKKINYL